MAHHSASAASQHTSRPVVAVVGGGVAGLMAAWWLQQGGAQLHLLDAHAWGSGATCRAAGMLAPVHELEFTELELLAAGRASRALYPSLAQALGDIGYQDAGALEVTLAQADLPALQRRYAFQLAQGLAVEWLTGAQARQLEPALGMAVTAATFAPDDAQVDPQKLVARLVDHLAANGAELHPHTPVLGVDPEGSGVAIRTATMPPILADAAVLATGVGLHQPPTPATWADNLQPPLPVFPIKGQMLKLGHLPTEALPTRPIRIRTHALGNGYLVPKGSHLLLGATTEERGHDPTVTAGGLLDVLRKGYAAVPGLYDLPVLDQWAGLRPALRSRQPYLARHPGGAPIWWLNGLYRHGILLGPLAGQAAAAAVLGQPLPQAFRPFIEGDAGTA